MGKNRLMIFLCMVLCVLFMQVTASAKTAEILISGPSSVAVGETVQLEASTSTGIDEDYYWFRSATTEGDWPFKVSEKGIVTGLKIGTGFIVVMGKSTGLTKTFEFSITSGKDVTLSVDKQIITTKDHEFHIEIDCQVKNTPPKGSRLYVAVKTNDNFYFFPSLKQEMEVYKENPKATTYQVIQFPIQSVPYNNYTFYAAMLNKGGKLNSNLDSVTFSGGYKSN